MRDDNGTCHANSVQPPKRFASERRARPSPAPRLQGYRAQKQREMGECVAYAESLREKDEKFLTPTVAHVFQEAVEDRRPTKDRVAGPAVADGPSDVKRSLKTVLRTAVGKEHPEARSSGSSSSYDSELSAGRSDDDGSRGSEFSRYSSDTERGDADSSTSFRAESHEERGKGEDRKE